MAARFTNCISGDWQAELDVAVRCASNATAIAGGPRLVSNRLLRGGGAPLLKLWETSLTRAEIVPWDSAQELLAHVDAVVRGVGGEVGRRPLVDEANEPSVLHAM